MILGKYKKVEYKDLKAKAQEAYNFQKASAVLAEYGFVTNLLKYDWLGADFLAQHIDGDWLKIQLKGRLTTSPDYESKDIHIMFEDKAESQWYLFPHDKLTKYCRQNYPDAAFTKLGHSRGRLADWERKWLKPYALNPRLENYAYESTKDRPEIISLINKAYQCANDVCATIHEDGKVSFLGQSYFRSFVLKVADLASEESRQSNSQKTSN